VPFLPLYAALVGIALAYDGSTLGRWGFFGGLFGAILGQVLGALFQTRRIRVRILRWQRVDQRGEPVEPTGFCRLSNAAAVGLNIAALAVVMPLVGWLILSVAGG
jgi:CDP-diglyceride synthetase